MHWRRPHEFQANRVQHEYRIENMNERDRLGDLKVFGDILEPSDIRLGSMGRELRHDYFLSAVAILA